MGLYHWYTENSDLALRSFNRSRRDPEFGVKAVRNMVEICLNPDNDTLGGEAFKSVGAPGDMDEGVSADAREMALHTAEKLINELPSRTPSEIMDVQILQGFLQLATKSKANAEKALNIFQEVSSQDTSAQTNTGAILGTATAYMILKQVPKARGLLKPVVKQYWTYEEAEYLEKSWLLLADIHVGGSKYDMATEALRRVLEHNKSCTRAYEYLGFIMEKEQAYRDASYNYEQAWKFSNGRNPAIGFKLAFNYMKAKRFTDAIDVCHQVLAKNPEYPKIRKEILEKSRDNLKNIECRANKRGKLWVTTEDCSPPPLRGGGTGGRVGEAQEVAWGKRRGAGHTVRVMAVLMVLCSGRETVRATSAGLQAAHSAAVANSKKISGDDGSGYSGLPVTEKKSARPQTYYELLERLEDKTEADDYPTSPNFGAWSAEKGLMVTSLHGAESVPTKRLLRGAENAQVKALYLGVGSVTTLERGVESDRMEALLHGVANALMILLLGAGRGLTKRLVRGVENVQKQILELGVGSGLTKALIRGGLNAPVETLHLGAEKGRANILSHGAENVPVKIQKPGAKSVPMLKYVLQKATVATRDERIKLRNQVMKMKTLVMKRET
ncbi:unnamed protein product [Cyprideis torosa]|uniref:Uncharacterized protein n=1 Tax=Cyprideis torosa TaxID=163714 RepID=A0A7R8WA50_9CRUS|nr:unnamed protein product [Cyprideis torosa]CAG0890580.1 unnamed protein product [Cyprideis torosa]